MSKLRTRSDRLLMVAAVAGFAASRIIPVPKPVLIVVGAVFSVLVVWLCGRALIRKRQEKLEDRKATWNAFVQDRNVS